MPAGATFLDAHCTGHPPVPARAHLSAPLGHHTAVSTSEMRTNCCRTLSAANSGSQQGSSYGHLLGAARDASCRCSLPLRLVAMPAALTPPSHAVSGGHSGAGGGASA